MAGTITGGQKAAATNKKKYGKNFYAKIGAIGGKLGHTGGFYANRTLARLAGSVGGKRSRRGKRLIGLDMRGNPIHQMTVEDDY